MLIFRKHKITFEQQDDSMKNFFLEQMAMYAAYHRDERNKATHFFGVPMIVFSLITALGWLEISTIGDMKITGAVVVIAVLLAFYIILDIAIFLVAFLLLLVMFRTASELTPLPNEQGWIIFGLFFVVGWIIQIWGHIYEGRKPALLDNLFQIFIAPSFLILEIFTKFGGKQKMVDEIKKRQQKYLP